MPQRDTMKIAGQQEAIADHEKKKALCPDLRDKAFAQRRSTTRRGHLDRLRGKKGWHPKGCVGSSRSPGPRIVSGPCVG